MRKFFVIFSMFMVLLCTGCIENDIPYPVQVAEITLLEVDGAKSVSINADTRTVSIVLEESTDIHKVNIRNIEYSGRNVIASWDIRGTRDLSTDLKLTLHTYDDYIWTIVTSQPIERYFTVSGQVGDTWIDAVNHRAITQVSSSSNRESLDIISLKLGPEGITSYDPEPSKLHDFTNGQEVTVRYHDNIEKWSLYVEETETVVQFTSVDPWTKIVWLKALGIAGRDNGFKYRKNGTLAWIKAENVVHDGGSFSASIDGLEPNTEYEVIAYCGDDMTETRLFTTGSEQAIPNSSFEVFSNDESDKYYSFYNPNASDTSLQKKWWGSGNKGSTTVGSSYAITMPDGGDYHSGKYSVKMASAYVVIKFAAGNIFSGEFNKTIGTSGGVINMGRPFTERPRKLTVWLKYKCGVIPDKCYNGKPDGDNVKIGDNDRGIVWVALGDWDYHKYGGNTESPVEVNTTEKSTFFDPKGENVIAYGSYITQESISEWTKVEIPLEYVSTSRKPTHIIVSAAASMLGDYFTGSPDSILWIDDIQLEY